MVLTFFWAESAFAPAACGTPNLPPPRIAASPGGVGFTLTEGGGLQSQGVDLFDAGATQAWSATANSNGGWLGINPGSSTALTSSATDAITLVASSAGLSPGNYSGSVTITPSACGATGAPATISASLTVTAQPSIKISASGGVTLTPGGPAQPVTITVTRTAYTGSVTLAVNGLPSSVTATITQPGTGNSGTISFTAAANATAVTDQSIGITASGGGVSSSATLRLSVVTNPPVLAVSASTLNFSAAVGVTPATQTFQVQNTGSGALGWTATVSGPFTISPTTGVAPTTVTVTATAQSQTGNYTGSVTVTALASAGATGSPKTVQLTFGVGIPSVPQGGIVSGASFAKDGVVGPNGIASLFGVSLASATFVADRIPLPTTLGATQVLVNDVAAPLFFVSTGQINFQVPWNFLGLTSVNVVVINGSFRSGPVAVTLKDTVPGIFTLNSQGTGQGAIQIANSVTFAAPAGSVPGASAQPVARGGFITIYCTGLGDVNNRPANGAASAGETTKVSPTVSIGGVPATVTFSGLAPGFVALYQVNAQVPTNAPTGSAVQLVLTSGGTSSNTVTIAVQ